MRDWLKDLRNEKKLTMKAMGNRLGISESYYCTIESGEKQKNMDVVLAQKLAVIFGLTVEELIAMEMEWKSQSETA